MPLAMNVRPYLKLVKCITLVCTHTQAASWSTGLDPSVFKAQTLTKHRTAENWAYSTPKSVRQQSELDKREKRETRVFQRFQDMYQSIEGLDH